MEKLDLTKKMVYGPGELPAILVDAHRDYGHMMFAVGKKGSRYIIHTDSAGLQLGTVTKVVNAPVMHKFVTRVYQSKEDGRVFSVVNKNYLGADHLMLVGEFTNEVEI